jgi:hypothetical protein
MAYCRLVGIYSKFLDSTNLNNSLNYEILYSNYETWFRRIQKALQNIMHNNNRLCKRSAFFCICNLIHSHLQSKGRQRRLSKLHFHQLVSGFTVRGYSYASENGPTIIKKPNGRHVCECYLICCHSDFSGKHVGQHIGIFQGIPFPNVRSYPWEYWCSRWS